MFTSQIATTTALARVRRLSASGEAKAIRIRANVSQSEVARDIGTTQPALSLWEAGKRRPSGDSAVRWLEILDQLERQ